MTPIAIGVTGLLSILMVVGGRLLNSRKFEDVVLKLWGHSLLKLLNVDVEVFGSENLPKEGAIYLFNHSSFFDIPIILVSIRNKSIRFGAKIELFSVPIFGAAMRTAGILPIARDNREKVLKLYDQSIKNLKNGVCYALAPEGTRSSGQELADFKSGPFVFALNGKAPIVPVVIKGAAGLMAKGQLLPCLGIWQGKVQVQILPPISTTGQSFDDRLKIKQEAKSRMDRELKIASINP